MRHLVIFLFLLIGATGFSQDTDNSSKNAFSDEHLSSGEPEVYLYNDTQCTFTPKGMGYSITLMQNGQEVAFGELRQTTDDGYFMLITVDGQEASFGRFDKEGNFRALRLDQQTDEIIEENFLIQDPWQGPTQ